GRSRGLRLRSAERRAELGAKLGDGSGEKLDLTLGPLLRGVKLGRERLAKGGPPAVDGPAKDEGQADERRGRGQKREQRGRIHGDRLSAPRIVSTSVRHKVFVWGNTFSPSACERSANASALERQAWNQPGRRDC